METRSNLKRRIDEVTHSDSKEEKDEKPSTRLIRWTEERSRNITETGITTDSQVSQLSATPPDSQDPAEREPRVKSTAAKRLRRNALFRANSPEKKLEVKKFIRSECKEVDALKAEYDEAVDAMITNCVVNSSIHNRRKFIGKFLYVLAKQYHTGDTMSAVMKEEKNGASTKDIELSAKKLICVLLLNAKAYGHHDAIKAIKEFRTKHPDSYEVSTIANHDPDIQSKSQRLKQLIKDKQTNTLEAQGLMKAIDDFTDVKLKELVNRDTILTEPYFAALMKEHAARIIRRFPNTAAHHIALFSLKISATLCNVDGVSLPAQNPPLAAPLVYAKVIAMPFMKIAAQLNHEYATDWVNKNNSVVEQMTRPMSSATSSSSSSSTPRLS